MLISFRQTADGLTQLLSRLSICRWIVTQHMGGVSILSLLCYTAGCTTTYA